MKRKDQRGAWKQMETEMAACGTCCWVGMTENIFKTVLPNSDGTMEEEDT